MAAEMHRRDVRFGLETMCIGGGQGMQPFSKRQTDLWQNGMLGLVEKKNKTIIWTWHWRDDGLIPLI